MGGVGGNVQCTVTCLGAKSVPCRRAVPFRQQRIHSSDHYLYGSIECSVLHRRPASQRGVFGGGEPVVAFVPPTMVASGSTRIRTHLSLSCNAATREIRDDQEDGRSNSPDNSTAGYVEVGIIGPPHGVQGECKVQPLTDWPEERLGKKGARYLKPPSTNKMMKQSTAMNSNNDDTNNTMEKVMLMRGRASIYKGREVWIVKIKGINSPEEVQAIRGYALCVHESVREDLEDEDEFYVQQLIGLQVVELESGADVGVVADVMDGTGSHDVLCITMETGETALVPFAKEIVPDIDVQNGVMKICPPEGLLDMYRKKKTKE